MFQSGVGRWKLGAGSRELEVGRRELEAGSRSPKSANYLPLAGLLLLTHSVANKLLLLIAQ